MLRVEVWFLFFVATEIINGKMEIHGRGESQQQDLFFLLKSAKTYPEHSYYTVNYQHAICCLWLILFCLWLVNFFSLCFADAVRRKHDTEELIRRTVRGQALEDEELIVVDVSRIPNTWLGLC